MRTVEAGQVIPEWSLPMTPTTIVSTAIATRDWQDVHHDRDVAQAAGSQDIFMNILTTNGLVERFVVDAAVVHPQPHADLDLGVSHVDDLADHPDALVEVDQGEHDRQVLPGHGRVPVHDVR